MTLDQLIARMREQINARIASYNEHTRALNELRGADAPDQAAIDARSSERAAVEAEIQVMRGRLEGLEQEQRTEEAIVRLQAEVMPAGEAVTDNGQSRELRAGATVREPRTYSAETSARGVSFFADAFRAEHMSDFTARERLQRHMVEVRAEGELSQRAQSTGGAAGLVIPQYLVDQVATVARAGRPIARALAPRPLSDSRRMRSTKLSVGVLKRSRPSGKAKPADSCAIRSACSIRPFGNAAR